MAPQSPPKRKGSVDSSHKETYRKTEPPPYEKIESRESDSNLRSGARPDPKVALVPKPVDQHSSSSNPTGLSSNARIAWPVALGLPVIVSSLFLFLITWSDAAWRDDMACVTMTLPSDVFAPLYSAAVGVASSSLSASATDSPTASAAQQTAIATVTASYSVFIRDQVDHSNASRALKVRANENTGAGSLGLGMWGWCLSSSDGSESTCSPRSTWWSIDSLLISASLPSGTLSADDFNPVLIHALLVHGIAGIAIMLAAVPMGLYIYRSYVKLDPLSRAGWFLHGTMLAACGMCALSAIVDAVLFAALSTNVSYTVSAGLATLLVAVSSALLGVSFLVAAVPAFKRHMRTKGLYADAWMAQKWLDVEAAMGPKSESIEGGLIGEHGVKSEGREGSGGNTRSHRSKRNQSRR